MTRKRLLVRVDALHALGLAHAVRCANLIQSLPNKPDLVVMGDGPLSDFFPQAEIIPASGVRPEHLAKHALVKHFDAVLIDHPSFRDEDWTYLASAMPLPLIVLNDYGGNIQADLIINGTVLPEYHHYPPQSRSGEILAGASYAMLHPNFAQHRWHSETGNTLIIIAGGGKRAKDWVLNLCEYSPIFSEWDDIHVVVGKTFPELATLRERCRKFNANVFCGISSTELAAMLAESTLALITGGMIVYECLAIGIPSVVFPQEKNLIAEADFFTRHGCISNLTYSKGMDNANTEMHISALKSDLNTLKSMSKNGHAIVDGHGMERAAQAVQTVLVQAEKS